jgi:hypothetical protein
MVTGTRRAGMTTAAVEVVIGVIPSAKTKTGMFSTTAYTLVVTNYRLIFARMTNDLVKENTERVRAEAKAGGAGFFGQWGAQLKSAFSFAQRYLTMHPEAILAESAGNAFIAPSQVREIKVERKWRSAGSDDDNQPYLRIVIETTGGKTTYDTDGETPNVNDAKLLLSRTFGALIH